MGNLEMLNAVPISKISHPVSLWGNLIALAILWFFVNNALRIEWSVNPQYSYGWGVPFLALYLFWKKWPTRPSPDFRFRPTAGVACLILLLLFFLPLRFINESNPDWRLIFWGMAAIAVALTLLNLWFVGGTNWLKHFSLPVVFFLTAVPWPTNFETGFIQNLMGAITSATVEAVNWMGIPALRQGNLILLNNGVVGVNEACSGVRSIQSTFMVAIFAGELYSLSVRKRFALLIAGIIWAIFLNFVRTTFLTWLFARKGPQIELAWHDPLGYLMLGCAIAGVWYLALRLKPKIETTIPSDQNLKTIRFIPWKICTAILLWLIVIELSTELWFRAHEKNSQSQVSWNISLPSAAEGFRAEKLPEETRSILRCDESKTGVWKRNDGSEWTIFFMKWLPGRIAAPLAKGHTPEICLTASGFKMISKLETVLIPVNGISLPFQTYLFEANGQPWHVFFCVMDDRVTPSSSVSTNYQYVEELEPQRRLRAVLKGSRHWGQQVLEFAIHGYASQSEAQKAVEKALPNLIVVTAN